MHADMLPPELNRRWSQLVYVRKHGDEWSSECPRCGDEGHVGRDYPDRFRMFLNPARGWCRHCGYQDFADSDKAMTITPVMRQAWIDERRKREEQARREVEHALSLLRSEQAYLHYEQQVDDFARAWWHRKGVTDYMMSYLHLGYCSSKTIWHHGAEYSTPTATIPVFAPGGELLNIRHRLINPIDPTDKYRPDRAGLPAALYLTQYDKPPAGECILVEGEIKSIVVWDRIDNVSITVAGTPGKNPSDAILKVLDGCDRIHVIFDPDATVQAMDTARRLGSKRARVVRLPVKADDFFTMYDGTAREFETAIKQGKTA